ncbi:MAG TPA: hypothetical protein VJM12_07775 [Pyrinomonadaceae bacterium]|nr:hypothetical protein [Pyrinomonadaceae bacterium]
MKLTQQATRGIVFVCRDLVGEAFRHAQAIKDLEGIRLLVITQSPLRSEVAETLAGSVCVDDVHDSDQLISAARNLRDRHGELDQIVTAQETLLEPVAEAGASLGLIGMRPATVRRTLNKSSLKSILNGAGINTPRHKVLIGANDARRFASEVGFPIVLKPLNGSGGLATWCVRDEEQLELALQLMEPSPECVALAEIYLHGQELCIDTITIANEPQFHSICLYRPSILEALEHPNIQWTCLMPRDINGERYRDFIEQGLSVVKTLSVENAMTHVEGFLHEDRSVSFTDATLRPAGARIAPMLAFAYDIDPYRAWARAVVDGCFDGPWKRKYAVGTIFLRGSGAGTIESVEGVETAKRQLGELLVDFRLPRVGASKSATYTGDGFITVRHPDTQSVEDALDFIARTVRIVYSRPESLALQGRPTSQQWGERLQHFHKLNKPAWDNDYSMTGKP